MMKAVQTALLSCCALLTTEVSVVAEPKLSIISQWSAGAEGAAMNALGDLVQKNGATWEHRPVSGFTTDMMNKLRADIIAGRPPAASQLKGPEIKAWSKIGATVNLDPVVAGTDYEKVVPPVLVQLHKPAGHWSALPLQIYRINTLYASKKAMDKVGATALPKTWDEFNALAIKMKAAGITPIAHGGISWADAMDFEIVLATQNPQAYRKAIQELDDATLRGPAVLAALKELRQMTTWWSPSNAGQHWSVFLPALMSGEYGFLFMGNWASGVLKRGNFEEGRDFLCGPAPSSASKPVFDVNADGAIFWDTKNPDYAAGQAILAKTIMGKDFATTFTQINGSIPVRTDVSIDGDGFQPCQRDASANFKDAVAADQILLSLGHNMAQTNEVTSAMKDVLTEFVHDNRITPEVAQTHLADAVDTVR